MRQAIHINKARRLLDQGEPHTLSVVRKDGTVLHIARESPVVSLSYDVYTGLRQIKFVRSGQVRTIRDCCIIAIDDFDVFL